MFEEAEKILGHTFKDRALLRRAFTHKSYAMEKNTESNERLAFMGDALLDFLSGAVLAALYPKASPGELTERRKGVVSNESIKNFIVRSGLDKYLLIGKTALHSGGVSDSMRADLCEALFAAMHQDGCRMRSLQAKLKRFFHLEADGK